MAFPAGVDVVRVTAGAAGYRASDGSIPVGCTLRITPSVSRVTSGEHGVIAFGSVNVTIGASGQFEEEPSLLATDADGFEPSGWTYRVDELFADVPGRSFSISLPAAVPEVALPSLSPVEASDGTTVWQPGGGSPSSTVVEETGYGQAAAAGGASSYARGDHTHGTPAAPTVGTATGTYAAGDDARITGAAQKASNLADLANPAAARTNLGLGTAAVQDAGAFDAAGAAGAAYTAAVTAAASDAATKYLPLNGDSTINGSLAIADGNLTVDSTGTAINAVDRGATTNYAAYTWRTAGVDRWGLQMQPGSQDLHGVDSANGLPFLRVQPGPVAPNLSLLDGGTDFAGGAGVLHLPNAATVPSSNPASGAVAYIEGGVLKTRSPTGEVAALRATPWVFNVVAYGAAGDARVINDGAITTGTAVLTSPSNGFANAAVGMWVSVKGAAATGVTTHIARIASKQNSGQVTLDANAAVTVSGAIVIFGTDDTAAIQVAVDAAEAYLAAGATYAQVYFPPRPYIVAAALNNTKSGNGQIVFGPVATAGNKRILEFRGEGDGAAAVRHWQQTVPQYAGSCLISFGVYASTSAQIANINADGNPAVLCGPNEGWGYGVSAVFSNMQAVVKNLAILTSHSSFGLTYGALNLYGVANAHVENVGFGTAGVVPGTDYTSPGVFGTGLSVGILLPAPGNNDHVVVMNIGCGGGYTYALFLTEHGLVTRYMALYCWAGLVIIGNYFGSVGSVHAMKVLSASIEACITELYIMGVGSSGIGPIIDIDQLSTESSTPNIAGQAAHMAAARGVIRWTGLFTEAGLTHDQPTGIESVNGQAISPVRAVSGSTTARPIDRVLKVDASGGAATVSLPSAAPNPVVYTVVKADSSGNGVTVDPAGSETINGSSTRVLSAQWDTVTVRSDGTNWVAI